VLVFAPLVFAHRLLSFDRVMQAALAFVCLSACASATYIINDLLDLESDRHHPRKRRRPFASGALSVVAGPPLAAGLLVGSFALAALTLPWAFIACLAAYFVLTLAYSLWLKRKMLVDVFLLAGLYTLRIIAGGEATDIQPSEWLLAMSMFLFTSLALVKRYAELLPLADDNQHSAKGRGYLVSDLSLIESFGSASAYLSVLVLALYIHSDRAHSLYGSSKLLWFVCPLMLYWTTRIWMQAKRRIMHDDPLLYAIKDHVSWIVAVTIAALMVLSL
jgi:4-hydroxybenzoate polyprenyltransferase